MALGGAAASKGISLLVRKYKFLGYPVSESIEMAMKEWKLIKPSKPGGNTAHISNSGISVSTPTGMSGKPIIVKPGTNQAGIIDGVSYSGHALDQMQGRGIVPSVVKHTIQVGKQFSTRPGTTGYYDSVNDIRVIINSSNGKVVTVIPGKPTGHIS